MKDGGDYTRRQIVRDAQHAETYRKWVEGMSPADRENLRRLGIDEPDTSYHGTGMADRDLADSPLASEEPDIIGQIEPDSEVSADAAARSDVLASFCARLRGCRNPALVFDAVCYGTGVLAVEGQTATQLAAKHGVTKQAFSKIAVQWCETFGLPPARSMKSKRARAVYRKRAKAVHAQHRLTRKRKS